MIFESPRVASMESETPLINADAIREALDAIRAIPDPVAREKEARRLQEDIAEVVAREVDREVKGVRGAAVRELLYPHGRERRTLDEVGALLELSRGRVQQLATGHQGR